MGFVLNHAVEQPTFESILDELKVSNDPVVKQDRVEGMQVFRGGPVEQGRGFVLHSLDYGSTNTSRVGSLCGVTGTLDALKRIASSNPPARSLMVLGYTGWAAGQLEQEIAENGWLTVDATSTLVFDVAYEKKYDEPLAMLGISESMLSSIAGHA